MTSLHLLIQKIGNLLTWIIVVAPWEQAIRVRLGKHVRLLHAGTHLRLPIIDRIYRQTIRPRTFAVRPQVLTTDDGITINLNGAIGLQIVDLCKMFNTLDDAFDTIEARTCSVVAEYITTHALSECRPALIEQHVMNVIDLQQYGLADFSFRLQNFAVVKTYRLISGDLPTWHRGTTLTTNHADGDAC
jgi:hypothetical protein